MTEIVEEKKLTFEQKFLIPLQEELAQDAEIVRTKLQGDLLQQSSLQAKWLSKYTRWKHVWIVNDELLKKLRASKYLKAIEGSMGYNVTKTEAKTLAGMDEEIIRMETKIENISSVLNFIDDAQKIIRDKSFIMSNIIRLDEFEAGLS